MASFATQVQIRRGTEAENDAFTGAEGEVTMDLTNKQLRVHDGQTKGGMKIPNIESTLPENADYVIERQEPTAENGYTWYRLYKSGWVEQGGRNTTYSVSFPIEMADTNYLPLATPAIDSNISSPRIFINNLATTGMYINYYSYPSVNGYWQVSGMSAQGGN